VCVCVCVCDDIAGQLETKFQELCHLCVSSQLTLLGCFTPVAVRIACALLLCCRSVNEITLFHMHSKKMLTH